MSLYDFLKNKAKAEGKKVFIKLKNDADHFGYLVPFEDITFIEDGPTPFCCFPGSGTIAENETIVVQLSQISEFHVANSGYIEL